MVADQAQLIPREVDDLDFLLAGPNGDQRGVVMDRQSREAGLDVGKRVAGCGVPEVPQLDLPRRRARHNAVGGVGYGHMLHGAGVLAHRVHHKGAAGGAAVDEGKGTVVEPCHNRLPVRGVVVGHGGEGRIDPRWNVLDGQLSLHVPHPNKTGVTTRHQQPRVLVPVRHKPDLVRGRSGQLRQRVPARGELHRVGRLPAAPHAHDAIV
mmetsp:Transcript_28378/g.71259  ORF Transcript_28378/g.71259 Transcript_28378/m.71259 type:complete len:208 (+) Transcript_28378:178-801(+)